MGSSEARWVLARLTEAFGVNGALMARKGPDSYGPEGAGSVGGSDGSDGPDSPDSTPRPDAADGADLVPGSVLRWPPCECGGPKCPDSGPGGSGSGDAGPGNADGLLSRRLAERNRRSSRGGV